MAQTYNSNFSKILQVICISPPNCELTFKGIPREELEGHARVMSRSCGIIQKEAMVVLKLVWGRKFGSLVYFFE